MSKQLKIVSLLLLGVTLLFYSFFMFAKHDRVLSAIIPFADDPFDAIGSIAVIVGGLLEFLALVRAYRPYRSAPPTAVQKLYLVRTQMTVVLAVLITAVADAITMARHSSKWIGQPGGSELVLLVAAMAALASAVGFLTRRSTGKGAATDWHSWRKAGVVSFFSVMALTFYPETIIQTLSGHLLSIVLGDVLLFAPISVLVVALVPGTVQETRPEEEAGWFSRRWIRWGAVVLLGLAVGSFCLLGEASEGGGIPPARVALVVSVFLGSGTTGLVIAYAFLRKPLGLFLNTTQGR